MAPSPTGYLHIGSARTTLFNWLFAKANNGKFLLRIEDTDKERSKKEFEEDIVNGIKWLGLEFDEFYRQSERTAIYKEHLKKLLDEEKAYYCFCTKEDLEAEKASLAAAGLPTKYGGRCRAVTHDAALKRVINGETAVIRFKVPEKKISFKDMIRGEIVFDAGLIGDQIIAKDLDNPLYNFVVVVDDALMSISHVIRAEDHLSNTPKQMLLYEAFGWKIPQFAHLPLILNTDRSKMSKRYLDTALRDYREEGYLKEALLNFMSYLGWHPKEDKEIMSVDEIVKEFTLERVQKAGAVFNIQKLEWLNAHYINQMDVDKFIEMSKDYLPPDWKMNKAMALSVKSRVKRFGELKDLVDFYFNLPEYSAAILKWKDMAASQVIASLEKASVIIKQIGDPVFNKESIEKILVQESADIKKGEFFWPLRVALSGKENSPTPFEMIEALGRDESLRRIDAAIAKIHQL